MYAITSKPGVEPSPSKMLRNKSMHAFTGQVDGMIGISRAF